MIHIHDQQVVGVAQVINKMNGGVFNKKDEEVYIKCSCLTSIHVVMLKRYHRLAWFTLEKSYLNFVQQDFGMFMTFCAIGLLNTQLLDRALYLSRRLKVSIIIPAHTIMRAMLRQRT